MKRKNHTVVLILDERDHEALRHAMRVRKAAAMGLPAGGGNEAGRLVAEISRGWLEMIGEWPGVGDGPKE